MNILDIIIVIIMGAFVARSFFNGLIKEAMAIIGIVFGVFVAICFASDLSAIIVKQVNSPALSNIMAYFLIFVLVVILSTLLGRILNKLIKLIMLKWLDRLLGMLLGAVKGIIIVAVLIMGINLIVPSGSPLLKNSILFTAFEPVSLWIADTAFQHLDRINKTRH